MKRTLILILLLILITGCTKVRLNTEIKETAEGVPGHREINKTAKIDIAIEKITDITKSITTKDNETEVESFGDVV
jgi:hypothetical protein